MKEQKLLTPQDPSLLRNTWISPSLRIRSIYLPLVSTKKICWNSFFAYFLTDPTVTGKTCVRAWISCLALLKDLKEVISYSCTNQGDRMLWRPHSTTRPRLRQVSGHGLLLWCHQQVPTAEARFKKAGGDPSYVESHMMRWMFFCLF